MTTTNQPHKPELVCPAGSLRALHLALEAGADAVYLGLKDATNARNFAGLNFDAAQVREGVTHAHRLGRQVLMALNTFADARDTQPWRRAVDQAAELGADALIVADSAVLPRVLTLQQVQQLLKACSVPVEVFGFGSLCVMVEGRCALSSYATGQSPNTAGVCSPPSAVRWDEAPDGVRARLGGVLIDHYRPGEPRGYPTLCKGRFAVGELAHDYALEEPTSLNTLALLPQLIASGVDAIKIEGRQRSPAYVAEVTKVWRVAIDSARAAEQGRGRYSVQPAWDGQLARWAEGQQHTLGAYDRPWR